MALLGMHRRSQLPLGHPVDCMQLNAINALFPVSAAGMLLHLLCGGADCFVLCRCKRGCGYAASLLQYLAMV